MEFTHASAPGKVTLFGEHAVVYGYPSIVISINARARAKVIFSESLQVASSYPGGRLFYDGVGPWPEELVYVRNAISLVEKTALRKCDVKLELNSELPMASGLGSSAAATVSTIGACALAMGLELTSRAVGEMAYRVELGVQGRASPMDALAASIGGALKVTPRGDTPFVRLRLPVSLPLILAYTPKQLTTKEAVERVRKTAQEMGPRFDQILKSISSVVDRASASLSTGDLVALGVLMDENESLLEELGVVSERSREIIHVAKHAGALGAKVSGGGFGGTVVALVKERDVEEVAKHVRPLAKAVFLSRSSGGLRRWVTSTTH